MDNNESQAFVQDIIQDPVYYYNGLLEDGIDLGMDENQFAQLFQQDEKGIAKVFEYLGSNKQVVASLQKSYNAKKSQGVSFQKNGGKFDYLRKLQQGGSLEQPKYLADEKPKGLKGWLFQATKYPRQDGQTGYFSEYITPAGDTLTTVGGRWNSWQRVARKGQQPRYQVAVGSDEYRDTIDPEVIEMLKNVHSRFLYPVKKQEGGKLSRKDAIDKAQRNKGYSKKQARFAYQNAKLALRNQGLRGSELRQAARKSISEQPRIELPEVSKLNTSATPITWSNAVAPVVVKTPSASDMVKPIVPVVKTPIVRTSQPVIDQTVYLPRTEPSVPQTVYTGDNYPVGGGIVYSKAATPVLNRELSIEEIIANAQPPRTEPPREQKGGKLKRK